MRVIWKDRDLGEFRGMPKLKEARYMKHKINMLPEEFANALGVMDPEAVLCLVSIMLSRNGEHIDFDELDGEYDDFQVTLSEEEQAQSVETAADELDPLLLSILGDLGVAISNEDVHEIIVKNIKAAQEGKGKDSDSVGNLTSTITSLVTPQGSGNSSESLSSP